MVRLGGRPGRPGCVSAEWVAAYADGRLTPEERAAVEAHAADCDDCREALAEVCEAVAESGGRTSPNHARSWIMLATAAVVVLGAGLGWTLATRRSSVDVAMDNLVHAVGTARFTEARLAEPFAYGRAPAPSRGAAAEAPLNVRSAAIQLETLAESRSTVDTLRGAGVAHLASGEVDEAIDAFQAALHAAPADAAVQVDLSAAFLERWRLAGTAKDASDALDHAQRAEALPGATAAARFNVALALEALHLRQQAIDAWQAVATDDAGTPWAQEAAEHLDRLRQSSARSSAGADLARVTPAALEALARDNPSALNAPLDAALAAWAREPVGTALDASTRAAARALRGADRDAFHLDLADAVDASARASPRARTCLAAAILAAESSRQAFTNSAYLESAAHARRGAEAAACAGLDATPYAEMALWAEFFAPNGRESAAAKCRPLEGAALTHADWFSYARLRYLEALHDVDHAHLSEAIAGYEDARAYARRAGAPDLVGRIDALLGETYRTAGDFDRAWTYHVEAFELLPDSPPRARHIILINAATTALRAGQAGAALALAQAASINDQGWTSPAATVESALSVAQAFAALGDRHGADRALDTARTMVASAATRDDRNGLTTEIAMADGTIHQATAPTAAVAALTTAIDDLARRKPQRAPLALLTRARAERALGDTPAAVKDLEAGEALFSDQRVSLRTDQLKTSRLDDLWDLYGDLIDLERSNPLAALDVAESARARALLDSLSRTQTLAPLHGPALYSWMPPSLTAVVYSVLDDRLLVWSVTRGGARLVEHPIAAHDLARLVSSFVGDARAGRAPATGQALADVLLPPDLPVGADREIVFLPDGPLYQVPFGLLPRGGHPLVRDAVPVVAPSLTILARAIAAPAVTARRALLIGYGRGRKADDLDDLPAVDEEVRQLSALYPDHVTLADGAATAPRILAALPRASLVHFAGHAVADDVYPSESKLFVAPDPAGGDALTPETIAATPLAPGTVVALAACDTARGHVFRGEGAMSLARPFLAAGASGVVASLWRVRDDDARTVLTSWHRRVAAGEPVARALAEVARESLGSPAASAAMAFQFIGAESRPFAAAAASTPPHLPRRP